MRSFDLVRDVHVCSVRLCDVRRAQVRPFDLVREVHMCNVLSFDLMCAFVHMRAHVHTRKKMRRVWGRGVWREGGHHRGMTLRM